MPDITFMLEVPESVSKERLRTRGGLSDRYELMGPEVMARIALGFREIASAEPERCTVIDGTQKPEIVAGQMFEAVKARLPK